MPSVFELSWGAWALVTLAFVQLTILCVTVYLHRSQAHRALDVHPAVAHTIRAWLWLTTAMATKQWVAVHRKHHAHCETERDPHSPQVRGLATVLFKGAWLYHHEARNEATVSRYGIGAPDDWLEKNLYTRFNILGPVLLVLINLSLFGPIQGVLTSVIQFIWIPVWAAGVVNGIGHTWGYRNFASADASRNISPWGIWIGGEELHNNHHAHPTSAKLSYRPWELDIGWGAIRVLQALRLATVHKAQMRPTLAAEPQPDLEKLRGQVVRHRLQVAAWYQRVWDQAAERLGESSQERRALKKAFSGHKGFTPAAAHRPATPSHAVLHRLENSWADLQAVWTDRTSSSTALAHRLEAWLKQAESSAIAGLPDLAWKLRRLA
jgi:stearoyl-CoA desaturase (delta-9 desaturase)